MQIYEIILQVYPIDDRRLSHHKSFILLVLYAASDPIRKLNYIMSCITMTLQNF